MLNNPLNKPPYKLGDLFDASFNIINTDSAMGVHMQHRSRDLLAFTFGCLTLVSGK